MEREHFSGAAVSTPLTSVLDIDHGALVAHLGDLRARGIDLLTLFGTTGRVQLLPPQNVAPRWRLAQRRALRPISWGAAFLPFHLQMLAAMRRHPLKPDAATFYWPRQVTIRVSMTRVCFGGSALQLRVQERPLGTLYCTIYRPSRRLS